MERNFHEELRTLEDRLAAMGALVEARTRDAVTALREHRPDLAAVVASGDTPVNDIELRDTKALAEARRARVAP